MRDAIRDWLIRAGFPEEIELSPLGGGFGSTLLWTFTPAPRAAPLVARVFQERGERVAEREYQAMRAAASHGVPVPTIVTRGMMESRPVIVMTRAPGETASQIVRESPQRAHAIGLAMGEALGRIHEVVAPVELAPDPEAWIERAGASIEPIRPLLSTLPVRDRLLHLDYHPNNVLLAAEAVSGIIDWENTTAGPPHIDRARTRAILLSAKLGGQVPRELHGAIDQMLDGITRGHASVIGPDPQPVLSDAWGMAMTVDDLAGHMGKPGSWVTEATLAPLRDERDRLIASVLRGNHQPNAG